jgi:glycerophosphoryl diester phosphodiesterase
MRITKINNFFLLLALIAVSGCKANYSGSAGRSKVSQRGGVYLSQKYSNAVNPPQIIAHRGSSKDFPENTIFAFHEALKAGANMIELDVQLTNDEVPVLFHPVDLSATTDGSGKVANHSLKHLKTLNAGYKFTAQDGTKPYVDKKLTIPTLEEALKNIPVMIMIDLKSMPAKPLVDAVGQVVARNNDWHRVVFYSTEDEHIDYLKKTYPRSQVFQKRSKTRMILVENLIRHECKADVSNWVGFELKKDKIYITEKLTLGNYETEMKNVSFWDDQAMECVKSKNQDTKIILFGINDEDSYRRVAELGAYAVFSDKVVDLTTVKNNMLSKK